MLEKIATPNLPSGYEQSEQLIPTATLDETTLPWLNKPHEIAVSKCQLADGAEFLLGSVVGSSRSLVHAAEGMTEGQKTNADNMFYSRIAGFIHNKGASSNIETMPKPKTDFSIHVMRNRGGQRVYFGETSLELRVGEPPQSVILRLAVCDKNRQAEVLKILSGASDKENHKKMSKSK